MAYELHIERRDKAISFEEWKAAVAKIKNARISATAPSITNPKTGEIIQLAFDKGVADIYSAKDKKWSPVFYWSNGKISFKQTNLFDNNTDDIWQMATNLASCLCATICGDQGEAYDLETGRVLTKKEPVYESPNAPIEQIKFIFRYDTEIENAAKGIKALLDRKKINKTGYKLYGRSVNLDEFLTEIRKSSRRGFELEGHDYSFSFGSVANRHLDFLEIRSMSESTITWDDWAYSFVAMDNFVMAWLVNSEYDHWQNASDPLQYTALKKPYNHLPMKSNELPYPLEKIIIDTSKNPGRWLFRDGYIEAVGAIMWLGEHFWRLTGANKSAVIKTNWLQVSNPIPSVTKVQVADRCFTTGEGASGELQKKLRALLFGSPLN